MEDYGNLFEFIMRKTDGNEQVADLMHISQIRQKAMELDFIAAKWVAAGAQATDVSAVLESYNPRLLIGTETRRITEYVKRVGQASTDSDSSSEEEAERRGSKARKAAPAPAKPKRRKVAPGMVPEGLAFASRFEDAFLKCLTYITLHADGGLGMAIREMATRYPRPALCRYLRRMPYTACVFASTTGNIYHAGSRHRNFDAANRRSNELEQFERQCAEEMLRVLCETPTPSDMWDQLNEELRSGFPNGCTADAPSIRVQFEHLGIHQFDTPIEIETALAKLHSVWEENGFMYTSNGRTIPYHVFTKADFEVALARERDIAPTIEDDTAVEKAQRKIVHELRMRETLVDSLVSGIDEADKFDESLDALMEKLQPFREACTEKDPDNKLMAAAIISERASDMAKAIELHTKKKGELSKKRTTVRKNLRNAKRKLERIRTDVVADPTKSAVSSLQTSLLTIRQLKEELETVVNEINETVKNLISAQRTYLRLKIMHAQALLEAANTQHTEFEDDILSMLEQEANPQSDMESDAETDQILLRAQETVEAALRMQTSAKADAQQAKQDKRDEARRRRGGAGGGVGVGTALLSMDRAPSPTPSQSASVQARPVSPSHASSVSDTVRSLVQSGTRVSHAFARIITAPN